MASTESASNMLEDTGGHRILVVDDNRYNVTMLGAHLRARKYTVLEAYDGEQAIQITREEKPDLLMLDVNMPKMGGLEVCAQLKKDPETRGIPVIMVTANSETDEIVHGFELGADDYLIKPYNYLEMLARVRSMLRIRDTQQALVQANRELDTLNATLEQKVAQQVDELEKVNRLRRFFAPQIVDNILAGNTNVLKEHRALITVVFLDLRNFTSFAEHAPPGEVIATIRELHHTVGPIIFRCNGTLERFTGDGLMVFLGDPEPMPDHPLRAVKMAIEIRDEVEKLRTKWAAKGYDLGLGIGVSTGEASLGTIGFEGRRDYAALGTVTNFSARLCNQAKGGQILISASTKASIDKEIETIPCGEVALKGFSKKQPIFSVA